MKKLLIMIMTVCFLAVASVAWAGLSVTLEWSPNSEPDLAGYNVYRSLTDGGPYTFIGSKPAGIETFTDETAEFDITYYWVITAFDNEIPSNESGYSNQVSNMTETPPPPDTTAPETPQDININVHITVN